MPDIYLYFTLLCTQPFFNNWHIELDKCLNLWRFHLSQSLQLPLKGRDAILPLEDPQVLVTCVRYSLVEQFVKVKLIAGEEVHGSCVEGEPEGLIGLGDWEDIEVERICDDPE